MPNQNYKCENGEISIKIDDEWIHPRFDRYEEVKPIAEPGANGVVVKATHKITQRVDAIKIWLPRLCGGENIVRRDKYEAEVQKITKISDPRIVTIHDAWIENGCYCCSMEYIEGITYEEWLSKNSIMDNRIKMLSKIFDAIVFYQSQGIIHGDIHSNNILIDCDENIHIIDFGTSCLSFYPEQSIHRENYLMYELVEKTLADKFEKGAFRFNKYGIKGRLRDDDVRTAIPIFFSKSVQSYLCLFELLLHDQNIINSPQLLFDYCRALSKGHYLSVDYYYSKLSGPNEHKYDIFTKLMFECFEDEIYEDAQKDNDKMEIVLFQSLYVYYNYVKSLFKTYGANITDVLSGFKLKGFDDSEKILDGFLQNDDLFGFHDYLLQIADDCESVYYIETNFRTVLYKFIEGTSDAQLLNLLQKINLQIFELGLDKELSDKIVRLSYNYSQNNQI